MHCPQPFGCGTYRLRAAIKRTTQPPGGRDVLLAALRSSGVPIRQHRRSHGRARQPAIRITRLPTDRGSEHAHHRRAVDLLHAIEMGAATDALHSILAITGPADPEHVALRQQRQLNRLAVRVFKTRIRIGLVTHAARPATQAISTAHRPLHTTHNACIAAGAVCCVRTAA